MADLKISALPAATTPVAGTEVLPIVQSSTTKKVSIDDLTKGRVVNAQTFDTDVAAAGVTLTGTTLAADGTDADIDINITPKGTGEVNLPKVDIDAGTIDGTTQATGTINGPIAAGGTWTAAATWTLPAYTLGGTVTSNNQSFSGTIANLGSVTTADLNGGTIDGMTIGASAAVPTHALQTSTSGGTGNGGVNFWKIGTWSGVSDGARLALKVVGASGYSNGSNAAGESLIYLVKDNAANELEGSFYSITAGASPAVVSVYWQNVSANTYDIFIRTGDYTNITPIGFSNGSTWITSVSSTGSTSIPSGAVSITSESMKFFVGATGNNNASTAFITANKSGDVAVGGALSKASGSFKIDHPLPAKADTHFLVHSFVESPFADLVYSGMVSLNNGSATVNIDQASGMTEGTFEALCGNVRRFCSNQGGFTAVKSSLTGNVLTITAQDPNCSDEIFWQVIGERKDKHMKETSWTDANGRVIVEPAKPAPKVAE